MIKSADCPNIFPTSLSVDIFNGLQKRVAFNIETSLDVQESMIFGNAVLNESRGGVNYEANFFDVSYRRYVLETTDSGISIRLSPLFLAVTTTSSRTIFSRSAKAGVEGVKVERKPKRMRAIMCLLA